jgi:hypothetical protein
VKLAVIFLLGIIKACCSESMCLKVIEAKTPGLLSSFISNNSSFLNLTGSFMPAQSPFTNQIYTHITQNLWRGFPSQPTHKQLPMGGFLELANL